MSDFISVLAIVFFLEVIDHIFGKAVGLAVAATALIGCLLFLWHAGKKPPNNSRNHKL